MSIQNSTPVIEIIEQDWCENDELGLDDSHKIVYWKTNNLELFLLNTLNAPHAAIFLLYIFFNNHRH